MCYCNGFIDVNGIIEPDTPHFLTCASTLIFSRSSGKALANINITVLYKPSIRIRGAISVIYKVKGSVGSESSEDYLTL